MAISAESEARKALARLKRALSKARRELQSVEDAVVRAEGQDFPRGLYEEADEELSRLLEFTEEEGRRLQAKVLESGGLEPGRIPGTSPKGEG